MGERQDEMLASALAHTVRPLDGPASDDDALWDRLAGARIVLLGEASHGTHDFYAERAAITRRLIEEHGFDAVAIEGDWPDSFQVNRYVRGEGEAADASEALGGFSRFPTWMWRNSVLVDFVEWLRAFNEKSDHAAGFYGMDLYSLYGSADEVLRYLERAAPDAATAARERYACFERFGREAHEYGSIAQQLGGCEEQAVAQLVAMRRQLAEARAAGNGVEEAFSAARNAHVVLDAEAYYRTMYRGGPHSWNLRDQHMVETLHALDEHLSRPGRPARIVVWAHNSHLGDARATQAHEDGEHNVGQLVRERWGQEARLVGFTTHHGTVTAAHEWDGDAEHKRVRPALQGSYEDLFHRVGVPRFLLDTWNLGEAAGALRERRLERMIGVIYRPRTERWSHYFFCELPAQFDVVIHLDETRALEPLERSPQWVAGEPPETFPFAY